jgi:hypothetical protein
VQDAFHTSIRQSSVNGEDHWANSSDPKIPAALAPVVVGVKSLHNFRATPNSHYAGLYRRDTHTGYIICEADLNPPGATDVQPEFPIPGFRGIRRHIRIGAGLRRDSGAGQPEDKFAPGERQRCLL